MRHIILNVSACPDADPLRLGRLTRHLNARLLDFGPGGPEVLEFDETQGLILTRFPGHDTAHVLRGLKQAGILAGQQGENALFCLQADTAFEDLDYVWGCLYDLLF